MNMPRFRKEVSRTSENTTFSEAVKSLSTLRISASRSSPYTMQNCFRVRHTRQLPKGYSLVILDAWRPISVQQALWDEFRRIVSEGEPGLGEEELDFKTSFFVSKPSYDIYSPSVHNTGGAVDLTLRDSGGHILNMGTRFDDFRETANTAYYEKPGLNEEIRNNRRLLYHTMLNAGFSNLPTEWWHYDYGTKFWAYFTGNTALYEGILER